MQVISKKGQTLKDIAIQYMGSSSTEIIGDLLLFNEDVLTNDVDLVGSVVDSNFFYVTLPITPETELLIDETDPRIKFEVLNRLSGDYIVSYYGV